MSDLYEMLKDLILFERERRSTLSKNQFFKLVEKKIGRKLKPSDREQLLEDLEDDGVIRRIGNYIRFSKKSLDEI